MSEEDTELLRAKGSYGGLDVGYVVVGLGGGEGVRFL